MRRYALATLILLTVVSALFGALSATYTPVDVLFFKLGNEVSTPNTPAGTFGSNRLVAYMGTIVITATGGSPILNPHLMNYNGANHIWLSGPMPTWGQGDQVSQFNVWAKTTFNSTPFELWLGNTEMFLNVGGPTEITQNPFIIDLFLASHQPSSLYVKDAIYRITGGSFGSFNIRVLESKNVWKEIYVPFNGQTLPPGGGPPATSIPIPAGGPGAPLPEIPYGEIPEVSPELTYGLTIITEPPFLTSSAYTPNSAKVATAQLFINGGQQNTTYKVDITFRNAANSPSFNLRLDGDPDGYAIPYALLFGNEEMTGGTATRWTPLSNGENLRDISVRILSPTTAQAAPSGSFQDVIYVEVTPVE